MASILPTSVTDAAGTAQDVQKSSTPQPAYSGSSINSIPHVAESLGTTATQDPYTGSYNVNGQTIQPVKMVSGVGHAPVSQVAQAAGYPQSNIQTSATGTTVMPKVGGSTSATSANGTAVSSNTNQTLNPYWQGVQQNNGLWMAPTNGQSNDAFKQQIAAKYGVDPSQIQMQSNGHAWVPFNAISNYAYNQSGGSSTTQQTTQQPTQTTQQPVNQFGNMLGSYLGQIQQSAPQAPQLQQLPTFDPNQIWNNWQQIQPFQYDQNSAFQQAYNAQNPIYQQMMQTQDQSINDNMNKRGIYNSGIAQNTVDQQNLSIAGKESDAIQKYALSNQQEAYKEWLGQADLTNKQNEFQANYALNSYKDNIDTMYKNGQLSNQQYADAINEWGKMVTATTAAMNDQAKNIDQTQQQQFDMQKWLTPSGNATLPYTAGMTPYQQATLGYNYYKTNLPYQQLTADQSYTQGLNQQKLQLQIAQDGVTNQQKWAEIMGVGPDGSPTLNMQKFQETAANDVQKSTLAIQSVSNNEVKTQLTALHDQLVSATARITALNANPTQANAIDSQTGQSYLQEAIQNYNTTNSMISAIAQQGGSSGN